MVTDLGVTICLQLLDNLFSIFRAYPSGRPETICRQFVNHGLWDLEDIFFTACWEYVL